MKEVYLHIDDKLYYRMRALGLKYNEVIAIGILALRLKRALDNHAADEKRLNDEAAE